MTATTGSINLSIAGGRSFTVDCYIPDAVATLVTMNPTGLAAAGSPNIWIAPQDAIITDIASLAAPTAVGAIIKINSAVINGGTFRWGNRLNTLSNRMRQAIPIKKGDQLSILQY